MIKHCGDWNADNDRKLEQLEQLLRKEHATDKVLIFSQYSDTANYIHRQLKKRGFGKIACVTGSHQNPTALVERFSPISNNATVSEENELRILVSTDVLSEGQNLQDCHVIINYDLPWAIIRLIQRAGRVDRIGQSEKQIFCYSFFPAEGVENIINLRNRLNNRINQNAKIVGSDEIFFEGNEQNLLDMFNEKSGSLDDDDDDNDVDLSSQAYQIWKNATDANPKLKKIIPAIPNIAYSTKSSDNASTPGVITYARTANDFDVLTWLKPDGEIESQSQKRILNAMACSADTPAVTPLDNHHELVGKAMEIINEQNITSVGGILGKRTSIRYRIYNMLNTYTKKKPDIFFTEVKKKQVDLAVDEIFRYPLIESTKVVLGQMLRNNNSNIDDIVDYILELRESGNFCRVDEDSNSNREPQIICSMGITDNHNLVK